MRIAEAMGCTMDGLQALDLALFSAGTFAAAFVTGLAGFAFGIVAAAVWLHFLAPAQVAPLIVAFALIVQGASVWKLRRAVSFGRIWPFVLGSAIGVPLAPSCSMGSRRADADGRRRAADRLCALQLVPP